MNLLESEKNSFEFFRKGLHHLKLIEEGKKKNVNVNIDFIKSILNYCSQLNLYSNNKNIFQKFETGYNFNLIFNPHELTLNLNNNQLFKKLKGSKENSNIKIYKNCIKNIFHFLKLKRKEINIQLTLIKNNVGEEKILVSIHIKLKEKERLKIISDIKYYFIIEKYLFIAFNNIIQ